MTEMFAFSDLQIPPPVNWQKFETLCWDLWRAEWNDPNTKKNGRQGQPQHGVDIYGIPAQKDKWAGVQCKGKDNYTNRKLTRGEIRTEIQKAKNFEPELSEFIIATTGPKDAKVEKLARETTVEHLKKGLFSVHVVGWRDIVDLLEDHPDLIKKYYPGMSFDMRAVEDRVNELEKSMQRNAETGIDKRPSITSQPSGAETHPKSSDIDLSPAILTPQYQARLDDIESLLGDYKAREALQHLEKLEKYWSNAPRIIKYELLTNMARAKLLLNEGYEAAKLLIKAWQYNRDEDRALSNRALGHLLLNQKEKAREYAGKALDKNPANCHTYSILAQTFSDDRNLEEIIAQIPECFRPTVEVAGTLGHLARKRGDFAEAIKWLEKAIEKGKEDSPDLEAELGEVLLQSTMTDESVVYTRELSAVQKEQVQKAVQLLTSSWERVVDTEIRNSRVSWIASRGLAKRLLGDLEGAIEDIEVALKAEPSDPTFIMNRAILAYENNDKRTAISLAKQIQSSEEALEATMLLAQVLREEGEYAEAIKVLEDSLKTNPPIEMKRQIQRTLILLFIDSGDFPHAINLSNSMRAMDLSSIFYLVDAARISRALDNPEEAISLLEEAAEHITDSSSFKELLELADEFFFLEQYENAMNLYERFVDKSRRTVFTYRLLESYYKSGRLRESLKICQTLRQEYGPLEFVSEMEATIRESIGDLGKAKDVCEEYCTKFPEDSGMNLRLAVINLRLNNLKEVDEFLDSPVDVGKLSMEYGFLLARLYAARNSIKKAFETIYEIRRRFPNNGNAHVNYTVFFFSMEKDNFEWLKPERVEKDTAVCIKDDSNGKRWYIIEDRKDWDVLLGEINLEHQLAKRLIGKSIEDRVLVEENQFSREYGEIVEIRSKYVHACQESLSLVPRMFPDISGILRIKVGPIREEGRFTEGFQNILDILTSRYEKLGKIEQFYKEKRMPLGTFAKFVGRNVIDVWEGLRRDPGLGINCCFGTAEERNYATSLIEKKPKLIVDMISVLTLYEIGAQEVVVEVFGKLGIAQSTIDLLQQAIDERKTMRSRGFATIWKGKDKYMIERITPEEVEHEVERLENIMNWVRSNCEVIACEAALDMTVQDRQKSNDIVGQSFIDTVLIASKPGNLLLSDDLPLRSLAKGEFDVDGTWTQVLLMYFVYKRIIGRNEYTKMVIKLVCSNYRFTSIDASVLIEVARQSKWLPMYLFRATLQVLKGGSSDERSALNISVEFICRLWSLGIPPIHQDLLLLRLLDDITVGRDSGIILQELEHAVRRRLSSQPQARRRVISQVELWKQMDKDQN